MDYDVFLNNYAWPIFGIAALVALLCWLPMKFCTKAAPVWLGGLIFFGFIISVGVMLFIGFFLPWGSPF